jgi:hypothetical protein
VEKALSFLTADLKIAIGLKLLLKEIRAQWDLPISVSMVLLA